MSIPSQPTIVFLDAGTIDRGDIDLSLLKKQGKLVCYDRSSPPEIFERIKNASIVITNKCVLGKDLLKKSPHLKLIAVAATGFNNIDIAAAKKKKILVANVAGYSTSTVVEHTFLFLLACGHRFIEHHEASQQKKWSASPYYALLDFSYSDLRGKTLGIVGYGTIGKKVARVAKVFGMKILVAKIPGRKYSTSKKRASLKKLLQVSDFVTLHCALSEKTFHLMNTQRLSWMKTSTYLLNLARGPIVDEKAMLSALQKNKIAGYATDVMEQEPPPQNHPFFQKSLQNKILLTPHIAWASRESRQRLIDEVAWNIAAFKKKIRRNRVV